MMSYKFVIYSGPITLTRTNGRMEKITHRLLFYLSVFIVKMDILFLKPDFLHNPNRLYLSTNVF